MRPDLHKLLGMVASGAPQEAILFSIADGSPSSSKLVPASVVSALLDAPFEFTLHFAHPGNSAPAPAGSSRCMVVARDKLIAVTAPDRHGMPKHVVAYAASTHHIAYSSENILGLILRMAYPFPECLHSLITVMCSDSAWASYAMALRGLGMAWLPESLVSEDLADGRLMRADCPELDIPIDICAHRSAHDTRKVVEDAWNYFSSECCPAPDLVQVASTAR